jgi:hypothetical protein
MEEATCGEYLRGFEAARAKMFVYFARVLIEKHGEAGKGLVALTVREMSRDSGVKTRRRLEEQGLENTWENHRAMNDPVYRLAWEGGVVKKGEHEIIIEYSYCPLADGFRKLGPEAEELGDIYCYETDDAFWEGYNPEWTVTREKTFARDGFCRLVWRRKP